VASFLVYRPHHNHGEIRTLNCAAQSRADKDAAQEIAFIGVNKAFFDHSDILINSSLLV